MNLDEYIAVLDRVTNELEVEIPRLVAQYGADLIDGITNRIQTTGRDAEGQSLKPYSAGYLAFKRDPGKTKRGRDLNLASSRYSGVVDYTLTGEMWRNIGLIAQASDGEKIRVSYGGRSELTRDKLGWLRDRDGDPLTPSTQEQAEAKEDLKARIDRILTPIK